MDEETNALGLLAVQLRARQPTVADCAKCPADAAARPLPPPGLTVEMGLKRRSQGLAHTS